MPYDLCVLPWSLICVCENTTYLNRNGLSTTTRIICAVRCTMTYNQLFELPFNSNRCMCIRPYTRYAVRFMCATLIVYMCVWKHHLFKLKRFKWSQYYYAYNLRCTTHIRSFGIQIQFGLALIKSHNSEFCKNCHLSFFKKINHGSCQRGQNQVPPH